MARKNIFDIINGTVSFKRELARIEELIHSKNGVKVESIALNPTVDYFPFETFIDDTAFKKWQNRGTCINCKDMRECLRIPFILSKDAPDVYDVLTYLEYVSNLFFLFKKISLRLGFHYYDTGITTAARENITKILDWLNYEVKEFDEEEKVLLVEKNAAATAVAETADKDFAISIIQYNHFTLKGDLDAKKEILLIMGNELELKKLNIADLDMILSESIFYMLNNLNIRRDNRNRKDVYYKDYVAKMSPKKLEEWYDELYQMLLLAFMQLEQVERYNRYRDLKSHIG